MVSRGVFVGRFQPFHKGHLEAVKYILNRVDEIIIAVGSAQRSHEADNPFTAGERIAMIRAALMDEKIDPSRYLMVPVPDVEMHSIWFSELTSYLPSFEVVYSNEPLTRRLAKEAGCRVESIPFFKRETYWATEIRRRMLSGGDWRELVPKSVAEYLERHGGLQRVIDLERRDFSE